MHASQNLLALGGFNEIIRLFDVSKKKDLGELMGDHNGTISAIQFYKNKFLITASEDSEIIIYRCKDFQALHKLTIKNKHKVIAMSLHNSGKILLALYGNGLLRLWNMMEARCKFKRKVGLVDDIPGESENEDADLEVDVKTKRDLNDVQRTAIDVKWEPTEGTMFFILYNQMLEVFTVASQDDKPCTSAIFDIQVTSADFISP